MAVHQLVPTFSFGDATSQSALHLRWLLRRLGHDGELYAGEVKPGLEPLVSPWTRLNPAPEDLLLYHHGIGSGMSALWLTARCRRGVVFHNISPAAYYPKTPLAAALEEGRAQLASMAPFADLALGVSNFNAAELNEAGYANVHTVPLFVEPERFAANQADAALLSRLTSPGPNLLFVSRVVPHKRFEDLLALHRELLKRRPGARLLLVGGYERGDRYFRKLEALAQGLGGVEFLGRRSHAELVAAYHAAHLFVSMSEHEGFGLPLLEAMAAGVPVMAYAAAAVPETLGGRGVAFTEKNFAFLAELACELTDDSPLRRKVLQGQQQRVQQLSADAAQRALQKALASMSKGPPRRTAPPRRRAALPRVAVVVQRYGDVSGGAELHAAQVAQHLAPHADLTVLTSCAADHLTWENHFKPGAGEHQGVRVLRFPTTRSRTMRTFNAQSRALFGRPLDRMDEEVWLAAQGPLVPGLLHHLSEHRADYDAFLFFTYLYAPTAWGLPLVANRALVVPTAHEEPPFAFGVFRDVFERPRALLCNTPEEVALIDRRFPDHARARVVGVGVDAPKGSASRFALKHGQRRPYLLYVGRVEAGKGLPELLKLHAGLVRADPNAPDLLIAGTPGMPIQGPRVRALGRISDEEKWDGLAGALAAVVPSRYESLSLLALEALAQGTPILVNGASEVLVGQVQRSRAGAVYRDSESFREGLAALQAERPALSRRARAFAAQHTWAKVVDIYREELSRMRKEKP